ncbi:MAG: peptidoglycan DD-metalloendopeptidase family protein [Thermoleophilaceae bacterium]
MTHRRLLRAAPLAAAAALAFAPTASADFGDRVLERGQRGHDVRVLQSWLTHLGFRTEVDGTFGEGTERSVDRYDRDNDLTEDHAVSRGQARRMRRQMERKFGERESRSRSRRSQEDHSFGERTLRRGDRGHDVRVLQSWLTHLGFETGVDGVFGRGTETRVERYENWSDIRDDGKVSEAQARLMRRQVEDGESLPEGEEQIAAAEGHVFPVQGAHTYGDGIGAGRNHRGADVMADCGTPLVAAQGGEVYFVGYQSAAGHYMVVTGSETGQDYVYMHMTAAPAFEKGDTVQTGQQIGQVGDSGNASACHLHFELWSAPGWYRGGDYLDPVPALKAWDRAGG